MPPFGIESSAVTFSVAATVLASNREALAGWGCLLIESDELGHQVLAAGGEAYDEVVAEFERNGGYDRSLPDDPLEGWASHNRSVLKPHGVWAVIAPFNYPMALAGGRLIVRDLTRMKCLDVTEKHRVL